MNPFAVDRARTTEPATIVIFGASGDLTRRKLVPALYSLTNERSISRVAIVGYSRSSISDEAFRESMRTSVDEFARRRPVDDDL